MKRIFLLLIVNGFVLTTMAQPSGHREFERDNGIYLGAGIGGGINVISGEGSKESFNRFSLPNLKVGYRISRQYAMMVYVPGGTHMRGTSERAFEALTITGQYWITPRLWLNAGAGLAIETTPFYLVDYAEGFPEFNTGWAATTSVGYEIFRLSKRWVIDLQLRMLHGNFRKSNNENHTTFDFIIGINRK